MAGSAQRGGAIVGINVTPLVDITLVLLVIFMVTARLIVAPKSIALDLPKAETGAVNQSVFSVELAADGNVRVDGLTVDDDQRFTALAHAARHRDRDLRAVIRADGGVAHRRVIHALDLLRSVGIARVAFAVVPEAPAAAGP
ncbi:MAG: biopolymer transporter ExbD [Polyangiaceae bacterium]